MWNTKIDPGGGGGGGKNESFVVSLAVCVVTSEF
jgi:hypothetical protein